MLRTHHSAAAETATATAISVQRAASPPSAKSPKLIPVFHAMRRLRNGSITSIAPTRSSSSPRRTQILTAWSAAKAAMPT